MWWGRRSHPADDANHQTAVEITFVSGRSCRLELLASGAVTTFTLLTTELLRYVHEMTVCVCVMLSRQEEVCMVFILELLLSHLHLQQQLHSTRPCVYCMLSYMCTYAALQHLHSGSHAPDVFPPPPLINLYLSFHPSLHLFFLLSCLYLLLQSLLTLIPPLSL